MASTTRLVAIHGGGDWADTSIDYIQLPIGTEMQAVKDAYETWYRTTYMPALDTHRNGMPSPHFYSLAEYACIFFDATEDDTLEVFQD